MEEELGYRIATEALEPLFVFREAPGLLGNALTVFFAEVGEAQRVGAGGGLESESEVIDVVHVPARNLLDFVLDGSRLKSPDLLHACLLAMAQRPLRLAVCGATPFGAAQPLRLTDAGAFERQRGAAEAIAAATATPAVVGPRAGPTSGAAGPSSNGATAAASAAASVAALGRQLVARLPSWQVSLGLVLAGFMAGWAANEVKTAMLRASSLVRWLSRALSWLLGSSSGGGSAVSLPTTAPLR